MDKVKLRIDPCTKSSRVSSKAYMAKELLSVLWVYRTTTRTPIEETLFCLAYRSSDESRNDKAMHLQLDLVDEVRAIAEQRLAQYQNLRSRDFQVEDLILRKFTGVTRDPY